MLDLTAEMLAAADAYCERTGLSHARVATIVINDGKFFDRVRKGGGLTVRTYEKFMNYFARSAEARASEDAAADTRAPAAY